MVIYFGVFIIIIIIVNIILHHTGHTFTQLPIGELDMYWQIVLDAFQLTLFVLFLVTFDSTKSVVVVLTCPAPFS